MVYKRSEYGKNFKVSSLIKNIPVYQENLTYRHLRRERECAHTPISWDGEVETSDSDNKISSPEEELVNPIAKLAIKEESEDEFSEEEEDENEDDDDDIAKEKKKAKDEDTSKQEKVKETCDVEIVKQNQELKKSAKEKLNKYVNKDNKNENDVKNIPDKKVCE